MKKLRKQLLLLAALLALTLTGCEAQDLLSTERADSGSEVTAAYTMTESQITDQAPTAVSVLDVPEFSGEPYVVLNGNEPDFTDELTEFVTEIGSTVGSLGQPGTVRRGRGEYWPGSDADGEARRDRPGKADGLAYGKI